MVFLEFMVLSEAGGRERCRIVVPDQEYHYQDIRGRGIQHERRHFGKSCLELQLLRIVRIRRTPRRKFETLATRSQHSAVVANRFATRYFHQGISSFVIHVAYFFDILKSTFIETREKKKILTRLQNRLCLVTRYNFENDECSNPKFTIAS